MLGRARWSPIAGLVAALVATGCSAPANAPSPSPKATAASDATDPHGLSAPATASGRPTPSPSAGPTPAVVIAAGDIADCGLDGDERTAAIVEPMDGTVLTLGDHAYPDGTAAQFAECYDPSWGRFAERTRPALGNHDYHTDAAAPYFAYFGAAAGTLGEGWYSFDLGEWHIVALNSNCQLVGCTADSPQGRWLADDLAGTSARCALAYMHHPRWSTSTYGDQGQLAPLWSLLHDAGADVVLSGHAHVYERFAPVDANGAADLEQGTRQFVVGTGGRSLYQFGEARPTLESRSNASFGVLRLTLHADSYEWEFIPVDDGAFTDAGSAECS